MAGWFWKVVEFLIGLIVLPMLVRLLWLFVALYFYSIEVDVFYSLIAEAVIYLALVIILFFIRKSIAFGLFVGAVWDVVRNFLAFFSQ